MKKLLLLVTLFSFLTTSAQSEFGIKAGMNYNNFNSLNVFGGSFGINEFVDSKNSIGYHVGVFGQFNFTKLFVRPELLYIQNNGSFESDIVNDSDFKISTLELPVLVGFNVVKPLNIYFGPSVIYNLDTDFSDFFDFNLEKDLTIGYAIGASVTIDKFGIDLRYAGGFSENLAQYLDDLPVDGNGFVLNTKPSQFLLSFSYLIN